MKPFLLIVIIACVTASRTHPFAEHAEIQASLRQQLGEELKQAPSFEEDGAIANYMLDCGALDHTSTTSQCAILVNSALVPAGTILYHAYAGTGHRPLSRVFYMAIDRVYSLMVGSYYALEKGLKDVTLQTWVSRGVIPRLMFFWGLGDEAVDLYLFGNTTLLKTAQQSSDPDALYNHHDLTARLLCGGAGVVKNPPPSGWIKRIWAQASKEAWGPQARYMILYEVMLCDPDPSSGMFALTEEEVIPVSNITSQSLLEEKIALFKSRPHYEERVFVDLFSMAGVNFTLNDGAASVCQAKEVPSVAAVRAWREEIQSSFESPSCYAWPESVYGRAHMLDAVWKWAVNLTTLDALVTQKNYSDAQALMDTMVSNETTCITWQGPCEELHASCPCPEPLVGHRAVMRRLQVRATDAVLAKLCERLHQCRTIPTSASFLDPCLGFPNALLPQLGWWPFPTLLKKNTLSPTLPSVCVASRPSPVGPLPPGPTPTPPPHDEGGSPPWLLWVIGCSVILGALVVVNAVVVWHVRAKRKEREGVLNLALLDSVDVEPSAQA